MCRGGGGGGGGYCGVIFKYLFLPGEFMKQKRPDYMKVELKIHAQQCFCVRNTRSEPFVINFHIVGLPTLKALRIVLGRICKTVHVHQNLW